MKWCGRWSKMQRVWIAVSGVIALAISFQNRLMYNCGNTPQTLPARAFGLPDAMDVGAGSLQAFWRNESDTVIYYFHGNGLRVENEYWRIAQLYVACNCTVMAVETPTCLAPTFFGNSWLYIVRSLNNTMFYSMPAHRNKRVFLLGASLGAAHALTAYASLRSRNQHLIAGIMLENPFTSVAALATPLPSFFIFNRWDNRAEIEAVPRDVPVLFLISERDEIVPPNMSLELFKACQALRKTRVILSGALHGHAASHPDYLPAIKEFLF